MLVAVAIRANCIPDMRGRWGTSPQCATSAPMRADTSLWSNEDIDVTNLDDLMWAVCTRSDPATSLDIIPRAWSTPLDPRISPDDKQAGRMMNSRAIIDATRPWEWRDQFPIVNRPSAEWRRQSEEKGGWVVDRERKKKR